MRILITGGFGFLGGRLGQHFSSLGHQVMLGSRNFRDHPDWLPEADVVLTDWADELSLAHVCESVDVVVHAAGMAAQECWTDPAAALESNGVFTARMARAAGAAGVSRVIYLSTVHVYAGPLTGSYSEESCPLNLHPYASSHLAGEHGVLFAHQQGQVDGMVLRLANGSGCPVRPDVDCWRLLVNDLCRQSIVDGQMVVRSASSVERNFIGVSGICKGVDHFMTYRPSVAEQPLYNIASRASMSLGDVALLVAERCRHLTGDLPSVVFEQRSSASGADKALHIDIEKAKAAGYEAVDSLVSEIDATLEFCRVHFGRNGI